MSDPKQLPYLLRLLDDKSPVVQEAVLKELAAFGPSLEEELSRLPQPPDENQERVIRTLLEAYNRTLLKRLPDLKGIWPNWLDLEDSKEKLEEGFALLSEFRNGPAYPLKLKPMLDQLAKEYDLTYGGRDSYQLADFLFKVKGLKGASESDYYHPNNSNLVFVIEKKRGIPISLAAIYILVGHRLGLNIEGCDFPRHFMARTYLGDKIFLVDCFRGGEFIDEKTILDGNSRELSRTIQNLIRREIDAETIIARVLANLINAYHQAGDQESRDLLLDLLKDLEKHRRR